jgi:hypothetical protein
VFKRHHESTALLNASVEQAFAWLDDFRQLSAHMEKPSAMMLGSRMAIETGDLGGRAIGSRVRMSGRMMGLKLRLEEVVVEREPPLRKAWQTVDARLVVIGPYRLGFRLEPNGNMTRLCVRIDYDLPDKAPDRWLGKLFGASYASWCTGRMATDAARHFNGAAD